MEKTWKEADEHCQQEGGRLASPSTKAKYNFIVSKLEPFKKPTSYSAFWIGATRPAASKSKKNWKFINGENVSVGAWWPWQPQGDGTCLRFLHYPSLNSENFGWDDGRCRWGQYFICELSTNTGR